MKLPESLVVIADEWCHPYEPRHATDPVHDAPLRGILARKEMKLLTLK
jgi:hypothetical protein